ncbi:XdhC family protein [Nioella aestuarii]|uniref:XdhC family protein n=1 Tax=Nioella aestuarii TaxID=1662864 RepID=UPI003D7F6068
MTPAEILSSDLADAAQDLRARDEPFAFATIVRTAGTTAAKPGAKALIQADGTIVQGFLGGGCTRGAVKRATLLAIETGAPQLISIAPEDLLFAMGVSAGTEADGVTYARNGCPSRGTVDIFIEPCLPMPELTVLGASPVAEALARLAPQFHWAVARELQEQIKGRRLRATVIATQGQGDLDALKSALEAEAAYIAFVGSAKKFAALSAKLEQAGITPEAIGMVSAPAGLNIGAVTPEEIALSIMAELTQFRRQSLPRGGDARD